MHVQVEHVHIHAITAPSPKKKLHVDWWVQNTSITKRRIHNLRPVHNAYIESTQTWRMLWLVIIDTDPFEQSRRTFEPSFFSAKKRNLSWKKQKTGKKKRDRSKELNTFRTLPGRAACIKAMAQERESAKRRLLYQELNAEIGAGNTKIKIIYNQLIRPVHNTWCS